MEARKQVKEGEEERKKEIASTVGSPKGGVSIPLVARQCGALQCCKIQVQVFFFLREFKLRWGLMLEIFKEARGGAKLEALA